MKSILQFALFTAGTASTLRGGCKSPLRADAHESHLDINAVTHAINAYENPGDLAELDAAIAKTTHHYLVSKQHAQEAEDLCRTDAQHLLAYSQHELSSAIMEMFSAYEDKSELFMDDCIDEEVKESLQALHNAMDEVGEVVITKLPEDLQKYANDALKECDVLFDGALDEHDSPGDGASSGDDKEHGDDNEGGDDQRTPKAGKSRKSRKGRKGRKGRKQQGTFAQRKLGL